MARDITCKYYELRKVNDDSIKVRRVLPEQLPEILSEAQGEIPFPELKGLNFEETPELRERFEGLKLDLKQGDRLIFGRTDDAEGEVFHLKGVGYGMTSPDDVYNNLFFKWSKLLWATIGPPLGEGFSREWHKTPGLYQTRKELWEFVDNVKQSGSLDIERHEPPGEQVQWLVDHIDLIRDFEGRGWDATLVGGRDSPYFDSIVNLGIINRILERLHFGKFDLEILKYTQELTGGYRPLLDLVLIPRSNLTDTRICPGVIFPPEVVDEIKNLREEEVDLHESPTETDLFNLFRGLDRRGFGKNNINRTLNWIKSTLIDVNLTSKSREKFGKTIPWIILRWAGIDWTNHYSFWDTLINPKDAGGAEVKLGVDVISSIPKTLQAFQEVDFKKKDKAWKNLFGLVTDSVHEQLSLFSEDIPQMCSKIRNSDNPDSDLEIEISLFKQRKLEERDTMIRLRMPLVNPGECPLIYQYCFNGGDGNKISGVLDNPKTGVDDVHELERFLQRFTVKHGDGNVAVEEIDKRLDILYGHSPPTAILTTLDSKLEDGRNIRVEVPWGYQGTKTHEGVGITHVLHSRHTELANRFIPDEELRYTPLAPVAVNILFVNEGVIETIRKPELILPSSKDPERSRILIKKMPGELGYAFTVLWKRELEGEQEPDLWQFTTTTYAATGKNLRDDLRRDYLKRLKGKIPGQEFDAYVEKTNTYLREQELDEISL